MNNNERHYYVYRHYNPISGKSYIGITGASLEKRWGSNGCNYKSCSAFYNAIQKYGWNNFQHEVLEYNLTKQEAMDKEKYYIKKYNSLVPHGYNLTTGGEMPQPSKETLQRFRESHLGYKVSAKTRQRMSISRTGHKGYNKKPVWMCDKKTHKKLRKFESITEAANFLGVTYSNSHIQDVCSGDPRRKSACGYFWCYAKEGDN